MSEPVARAATPAAPAPSPNAGRPSVIQLVFREKGALYAAYMPTFSEGGIFVPTTRDYKLGEDIYLLLSLPDDPQRYPVAGKVGWITPANASGGRHRGTNLGELVVELGKAEVAMGVNVHEQARRPERTLRSVSDGLRRLGRRDRCAQQLFDLEPQAACLLVVRKPHADTLGAPA